MDPERVDMGRDSRVLRGGSWAHPRDFARAAYRATTTSSPVSSRYGFRWWWWWFVPHLITLITDLCSRRATGRESRHRAQRDPIFLERR
jgi:hypothetical protein